MPENRADRSSLTPWNSVPLVKLIAPQKVKKFLTFLWAPKVHFCSQDTLIVSLLDQMIPGKVIPSYFF